MVRRTTYLPTAAAPIHRPDRRGTIKVSNEVEANR
jgi:hypothetical protein